MKKTLLAVAILLISSFSFAQEQLHPKQQRYTGSSVDFSFLAGDYEAIGVQGKYGFADNHAVELSYVDSYDIGTAGIGYQYGGEGIFVNLNYNIGNDVGNLPSDFNGGLNAWSARIGYEFDLGDATLIGNGSSIYIAYTYQNISADSDLHYGPIGGIYLSGNGNADLKTSTITLGGLNTYGQNNNWFMDASMHFNSWNYDEHVHTNNGMITEDRSARDNFFQFESSFGYIADGGFNASFEMIIDNTYNWYSMLNFGVGLSLGYNF